MQYIRIYGCAIVHRYQLLVLSLLKLIMRTNSQLYFKRDYKNVLRLGVWLYIVTKCARLQFCNRMFIYCAMNELLTEGFVIGDSRVCKPAEKVFCERNQSKTKAVCYIAFNGPFFYGFIPHYNVHRMQFVHLIFLDKQHTDYSLHTACFVRKIM